MEIITFYRYLTRAREDLWAVLETIPDQDLGKPVLGGTRFGCIKDLVMHIPAVEDSWLHEDILRDTPVWQTALEPELTKDGAHFADVPLVALLNYWKAVQQSTLVCLPSITDLERVVEEERTVGGLIWHFMLHEVRHTAQIAVLLRQMGYKPPALDLLWYLPLKQ